MSQEISLKEAVQILKRFQSQVSLSGVVRMLKAAPESGAPNKSTVARWIGGKTQLHPTTEAKIVRAAEILMANRERPITLTAGVVKASADAIPVLLIPKLPQLLDMFGVKIEVEQKDSVYHLLQLLEAGKLDFVAAPRHATDRDQKKPKDEQDFPSVRRFFKIAELEVAGLFPSLQKPNAPPPGKMDLLEKLNEMAADKQNCSAVGTLENGDYGFLYAELGQPEYLPPPEPVTSSRDAVAKLLSGKIHAFVGHRLTVENTHALLNLALRKVDSKRKKNIEYLRKLAIFPHSVFAPAKMDIWCNPEKLKTRPGVGGKIFHLLCGAMAKINKDGSTPEMIEVVNDLLELDKLKQWVAGDKHFGKNAAGVIQDATLLFRKYPSKYVFKIETFVSDTVEKLWPGN